MQGREFFKKYEIRNMKNVIRKLPVFLLPLSVLGIYLLFRANLISQDSWKVILGFSFSVAFALSLVPFRDYFNFKMSRKIEKWLPYFLVSFGFVIYGIYGLVKFYHFGNPAWDFGLYDQWIWKISKLQEARGSLWGAHVLADNFPLIVYLIAPIYWIFNHAIVLILFEILVVSFGALPIYWLARKRFKINLLPIALCLAYIFYIGNQYALNFSFHPSTLFATLFLFAFYFFEEKRYFWHFVFLVLALICKVNVALYIIGYGFFLLLQKYRLGAIHVILGLAWFIFATKMMIYFGGEPRFGLYASLGKTPLLIIQEIILHPIHPVSLFLENPEKVFVLFTIFASFGFLVLLSPSLWPIFLPMLAERFWSSNYAHWILVFHYGAPISAILVLSAMLGVLYLKKQIRFPWEFFVGVFLIINLLSITYLLQAPIHNLIHRSFWQSNPEILSANKAIKLIPKEASVSAQDLFVSHLAHREKVFLFPGEFNTSQFVLLDIKKDTYPIKPEEYHQYVKQLLADKNYGIKFNEASVILLERGLKSSVGPSQEILNFLKSN